MSNLPKYQTGSEVDYTSYGFIDPMTMESLFTNNSMVPDNTMQEAPTEQEFQPEQDNEDDNNVSLRQEIETLKQVIEEFKSTYGQQDPDLEIETFMNTMFGNYNMPIDPDEMESEYVNYKQSQLYSAATNVVNRQLSDVTPAQYLKAIFSNEKGQLGQKTRLKGTATGTYQIVEDTRKNIYEKYFKNQMTYQDFENKYKTDPAFEYSVAEALANENLSTSATLDEAIGKWYSPTHVARQQWDEVPFPNYGNTLTLRQYVDKVKNNMSTYQQGGYIPTAILPDEQYEGLNNSSYNQMLFNTEGYNQFRGLDTYEPVYIVDEAGKERVLIGPDDVDIFFGNTYEERLEEMKNGGIPDRYKKMGFSRVNSPKRTPSHKTKSHAVLVKNGKKYKIIRFGQQGVKGSPKKSGESDSYRKRRESFKARHSKNIAKGKNSAAYWANKVKW